MDGSTALSRRGEPLHGHFFGQSSFATHAVADALGAVKIDPDVPFDIAAPPQPLSVHLPLLLGGGRSLRGIIGGDAAPSRS
ncbi:MAG: hypothetical protein RLZZ200_784 [Pseudomonadota bacterium]|jgi:hypothetical protein